MPSTKYPLTQSLWHSIGEVDCGRNGDNNPQQGVQYNDSTFHATKIGRLREFSIPIDIDGFIIKCALCDLGADISIMPYILYIKLNLGNLHPTNIFIRFADRSVKLTWGVIKDVPIQVKNINISLDFIVMEKVEDEDILIILGTPFLYTTWAITNSQNGSLSLNLGRESVVFHLPNFFFRKSYIYDCNSLDLFDTSIYSHLTDVFLIKVWHVMCLYIIFVIWKVLMLKKKAIVLDVYILKCKLELRVTCIFTIWPGFLHVF